MTAPPKCCDVSVLAALTRLAELLDRFPDCVERLTARFCTILQQCGLLPGKFLDNDKIPSFSSFCIFLGIKTHREARLGAESASDFCC